MCIIPLNKNMIFNEIYGCYYNAVSSILNNIIDNTFKENDLYNIINEKAFSESFIYICDAINNEKYKLIFRDKKNNFVTPIRNKCNVPLSNIEMRWLKSIINDPRIKLFDLNINFSFLKNIKPLFKINDYYIFDRYSDGDPYDDSNYICIFRNILYAIKNEKKMYIKYVSRNNRKINIVCSPYKIEYSEKDDKFRVIVINTKLISTINIASIKQCKILNIKSNIDISNYSIKKRYVVVNLYDARNVLERFMLHFSHFEKETEKIDINKYKVKIYYYEDDEKEMVIRILSFGQFVKVIEPQEFIHLIVDRLKMQKKWNL